MTRVVSTENKIEEDRKVRQQKIQRKKGQTQENLGEH